MESLWTRTAELPRFAPLEGDLRTDVLVVGGGLAGLLCAYRLSQAGADCALVEAGRICGGVTGDTTAKISLQHGLIYDKMIRKLGAGRARLYLEAARRSLEQYRELCRDIDCGFQERDSFVYSRDGRSVLDREAEALRRLGAEADVVEDLPLPFPTAGAVRVPRQAQFHPLRFAAGIAGGLRIFERTKVRELAPGRAVTSGGTVRAESIVIATHFPILNKHGSYFLKLYQDRSYVLALEGASAVDGMYVDGASGGPSFRDCGPLLLLGGGGGRTGKHHGGWRELRALAKSWYPEAREAARWAAQDCMSLDGVPYIGRYSRGAAGLYVAAGFNKWGMTSSMTAAGVLTDMILGRDSPFAPVFDPARSVLRPQLAVNVWESALGLISPTVPRCPHMGCALRYNASERTWDCPCHGSRFAEDGTLLDGPATDGKKM